MSNGTKIIEDYRSELNNVAELWAGVVPYLDEQEMSILRAVIENNGLTLYRLSKITGLAFSTVFKKTRKLSSRGIIVISKNGKCNSYSATVLGLVICLAKSCLDKEYVAFKLLKVMSASGVGDINELIKVLKAAASSATIRDVSGIRNPSDLLYLAIKNSSSVNKLILGLIIYHLSV
jgi:predicted transcriptional regulator